MKRATIQDIADAAKVSKSTVSRVLNNTSAVHPEKRRAVLEATERLGFKPNIVARSLAKGRSMTLGILTQNIGSPFYDAISQGVITTLGDTAYSPIFADGRWVREMEIEAIQALLGRRVDGLILIGGTVPDEELAVLCRSVPTVVVARQLPEERHHCICVDNVDGGYQATRHLIGHGHRDIAVIAGISHHPDAIDRLVGYRRALAEAGLPVREELILEGDYSPESGVRAIDSLLDRGERFTAVFAANDTTALGARLALYRRDIAVPGDVSIIGFDDQAEAAFMAPPLTTIRQPAREMGTLAARGLLDLIEGNPFHPEPLRAELQVRESVGPAPEGDGRPPLAPLPQSGERR